MARPQKNKCDYFSHDADMRHDLKIKALRAKFGLDGYAIWCMLLELLCQSDFAVFKCSKMQLELLSGDFGVDSDKISNVIQYCIELELLQASKNPGESYPNCTIFSKKLHDRLQLVYEKRGRYIPEDLFSTTVIEGETTVNPKITPVIVSDNPQTKLNKRKVDNIKTNSIILLPNEFRDSTDFTDAWQEWEQYRKQRKGKLTPITVKHQIKFLSQFNINDAIAIIQQSIQNGWIGLFELKNKTNGKQTLKNSADIIGKYYQ